MIDPAALAGQLASLLAPALPYLVGRAGNAVAEHVPPTVKPELLATAKGVWDKLRPSFETKPAASEAAHDVAAHPDDADSQAALRLQLKKLLADDPLLAEQLRTQLAQVGPSVSVAASGERSAAVGGSLTCSSIVTGDRAAQKRPARS